MAATLHCAPAELFVFESGMAAISAVYRLLTNRQPGRKTLQLCFPYVDALKVQEQFGSGVDFVPMVNAERLDQALAAIREGRYAAVFCEVPSNPLLNTVDLPAVAQVCRVAGTPLVVDDTVCSHLNLDAGKHADVVTTSLTKWVSGIGDVMAGSVKLTGDSPLRDELREKLEREVPGGTLLYGRDAEVLLENATGFPDRVAASNAVAGPVVDFLVGHPRVERVWHPTIVDRDAYDALRVPTGGYGGLLSFTLREPARAPAVYNATRLSKGPSLGTEYSLLCPYTLLAHYEELPWAEECGVATNLLRLSVGMESPEALITTLQEALAHA